ncbi:MAG TPA: DUF488 domain-containing protein [Solirubrobacteraceae bacterium]|nr:DUF488 domain-containing protein [Solirubrobacteraceae bacterium]
MAATIYTVGHSTRTQEEFLTLLTDHAIGAVVDVRAYPSSRRHPQFNAGALAEWLPAAGIRYVHSPQLGGRRRPQDRSKNAGWREQAFQAYADHMTSAEFADGLNLLEQLATNRPTAVMCAEALWWRCHRRLIADALTARGWRVTHLGVDALRGVHELPDFAVVHPDGRLTYPPPQSSRFAS